jgi:hypothetical protein
MSCDVSYANLRARHDFAPIPPTSDYVRVSPRSARRGGRGYAGFNRSKTHDCARWLTPSFARTREALNRGAAGDKHEREPSGLGSSKRVSYRELQARQ